MPNFTLPDSADNILECIGVGSTPCGLPSASLHDSHSLAHAHGTWSLADGFLSCLPMAESKSIIQLRGVATSAGLSCHVVHCREPMGPCCPTGRWRCPCGWPWPCTSARSAGSCPQHGWTLTTSSVLPLLECWPCLLAAALNGYLLKANLPQSNIVRQIGSMLSLPSFGLAYAMLMLYVCCRGTDTLHVCRMAYA